MQEEKDTLSTTYASTLETYSPSGKIGLVSIPVMLALGGALGIAAAFIIHLVWQLTGFYLIFLFPAGIGFAAGIGLNIGVRVGSNRSAMTGAVGGLVVGVVSYASMHYFDSLSYGASDPMSYLSEIADIGYTILFIPISGPFAWLSWILEMGVVIFLTITMASGSAAEPYCEEDGQWCEDRTLFVTTSGSTQGILTAMSKGDYHRIKDLQSEPVDERDQVKVDVHYCGKCIRKGYLTLTAVTPDGDDDTEEEVLVAYADVGPAVGNLLRDFPADVS
jgi:hypothetical protein